MSESPLNTETPNVRVATRAILLDDQGRVILGKRAGGIGAGEWTLLGGKPDQGEELDKAVQREVEEEAGFEFEPKLFKEQLNDQDPQNTWKIMYFSGKVVGEPKLDPREVSELKHVTEEELRSMEIAFNQKDIILEFLENQRKSQ